MAGLAKYIPDTNQLAKKGGEVDVSSLSGKIVFFYFSASWCPPCRGFTPQLIEFYEAHAEKKNFEVVLAPWDEEEDDFDGYFAKMPWLSIPFAKRNLVEALNKEFNVQSIPTIIGVDADSGEVVTTRARQTIVTDPEGTGYPWKDE